MVGLMKSGSVVVDLAAEQGGNCDLTKPNKVIKTENGVTIIGYTDFPSRMSAQSSTLYATNIRHMLDDLTPENDGNIFINLEDDVIRGALVSHNGDLMFPPPAPKVAAIGKQPATPAPFELTAAEKAALEQAAIRKSGQQQIGLLVFGGLFMLLIGSFAPASFMQHFIVFALSCFVGFQVIWNVSHALHTPLMAVTNAISGIIILGALLQIGSSSFIVTLLASISVLIATINIVGGFMVTRRMLAMFQKS
jgi:NAD(P) transhydrogenase subunit alpha